ncbi:MAG: hypothetical protein ACE5OT_04330 [Candidatus Hadarchaeaceae archaeon]
MRLSKYLIIYFAVIISILVISILRGGTLHDRMRTFVDLLFFAGGITMVIGGFFLSGWGRPGFGEWYAHSAGRGDQVKIYLEHRETQRKQGALLFIFGLALMALSIVIGIFFL